MAEEATFLRAGPSATRRQRLLSIDVARGLIIMIMALDHASVTWNARRSAPEIALSGFPPTHYENGWQQVTREVTHVCAPGFQLLAGLGLALSVRKRMATGRSRWRISTDILLRAAALFFCEWVLLFPIFEGRPFIFVVLCCIGSSMAIFSVVRFLPRPAILLLSILALCLQPLYAPAAVVEPSGSAYFRNIWTQVALAGPDRMSWWVLYPILPWIGFFGVGWWLSGWYEAKRHDRLAWLPWIGIGFVFAGIALRWFGGSFGDRTPGGDGGPWTAGFWALAKYPPTPAFSAITLGANLVLLGLLGRLDLSDGVSAGARFVATYGRVALFFYVVHFYLYGAYPFITGTLHTHGLPTTYFVWLGGLVLLWPICLGYGKLRSRYNAVLRYF